LHREAKELAFGILRCAAALRVAPGSGPNRLPDFVAMKAARVAVTTDGASHER
jgi:hypothetical protein